MKNVIVALLVIMSLWAHAGETGEKGFKADVSISGFFSPEVKSAIINSVVKNSSAEEQGIKVGHEIVAIDGCEIPGCPASVAKKALQKSVGETVVLTMLKPDGDVYEANVTLQ